MTKHLYINPKNFDQLVLSGVLIELLKSDVEIHSQDDGEILRFVQGENVVENNIENILRFANTISKHKIFGRNWQQQAVINMINGVCKDIQKKLSTCVQSSQLTDKIEFLNQYWFNKSNEWLLKKGFLACHMQILTLSFLIQEKFPVMLAKYQCFVELRKLFIEEKLLSKPSLIAMFTHPENKYQQYDLFPQLEQCVNDVRRSMGSQYGDQFPHQNHHQHLTEVETVEVNEIINLNSQEHHLNDEHHHITSEQTDPISYIQSSEKYTSRLEPQHIVISKLIQHESAVVANIPSQIEERLEEIPAISEIQTKVEEYEANHHHQDENESDTKAVALVHSHDIIAVEQRSAQAHQQKVHSTENINQQNEGKDQLIVHDQENVLEIHSQHIENKPPMQQSNRGSINGPKSNMNTKIRVKQQSAIAHKETCKCEIF